MTTFEQSDWAATIVAAGTSGTIRKSPDPSSSREGAGPPDYSLSAILHMYMHTCVCRFWKMATTFTGLKLQGQLGKFGRIEISDISAYVELPDGKVLSGTEWGNLLLWDGGFIKVEISRKGKKCHNVSSIFNLQEEDISII